MKIQNVENDSRKNSLFYTSHFTKIARTFLRNTVPHCRVDKIIHKNGKLTAAIKYGDFSSSNYKYQGNVRNKSHLNRYNRFKI